MKLTDIKKNADTKAAEVEAARKHTQLMAELDVHPLLKWDCDRYVRDAYFGGIVFAAMTDDAQIDEKERKVITRIGHSLRLSQIEIDEVVGIVLKTVTDAIAAGGGGVFALLEESVSALKDEKVYRLFVAEYVKVCAAKEFDVKDVELQLQEHVALKLGRNLNQFVLSTAEHCVSQCEKSAPSELLALAEWMGDDACLYFMLDCAGDVSLVLRKERVRRRNEEAKIKAREEEIARQREEDLAKKKARLEFMIKISQTVDRIISHVTILMNSRENDFRYVLGAAKGICREELTKEVAVELVKKSNDRRRKLWILITILAVVRRPDCVDYINAYGNPWGLEGWAKRVSGNARKNTREFKVALSRVRDTHTQIGHFLDRGEHLLRYCPNMSKDTFESELQSLANVALHGCA